MLAQEITNNSNLRFHDYADVLNEIWFYDYIQTASLEGIVKGYTDGYFRPNKNVSRIEFLKMVMKTGKIELNKSDSNSFPDMPNNFWGTTYSNTGFRKGIISGYNDGNFRPNQDITRAEAAKIVSYLINL